MSLVFTYDGSTFGYGIPPTKVNLPQRAELGSISMGGISPEDPAASLALVGHRPFHVDETDCSQPRLFTGWVAERNIGRSLEQGQFVGPDARIHDTTIVDLNACFGFRIITGSDGNRPAETVSARLAWLLASDYLTGLVADTGFVASVSLTMEAADYRGQYPADVLSDLSGRSDPILNYHAFWDPTASAAALFFDYIDEAVSPSCAISISNVLADINGTTVFAPATEARLERTPETVYSDVVVDYANGSIWRSLAATVTAFIKRGTKISRPYASTSAAAISQGDAFLASHAKEVDRLTLTIHVPSSVVGLLWAGQRMDVKFSHLPGYTSWTSMRIVASNPRPVDDLAFWYDVDLELVATRVSDTSATTGGVWVPKTLPPLPPGGGNGGLTYLGSQDFDDRTSAETWWASRSIDAGGIADATFSADFIPDASMNGHGAETVGAMDSAHESIAEILITNTAPTGATFARFRSLVTTLAGIIGAPSLIETQDILIGWRLDQADWTSTTPIYGQATVSTPATGNILPGGSAALDVMMPVVDGRIQFIWRIDTIRDPRNGVHYTGAINAPQHVAQYPGAGSDEFHEEHVYLTDIGDGHTYYTLDFYSGGPLIGQSVSLYPVGVGDGVASTFKTLFPYSPGSLSPVTVDGVAQVPTELDPTAGTFTLPFAPATGEIVAAAYIAASVTPVGTFQADPAARIVPPADVIPIADAGSYFTGTNVELALQELGAGGGGGGGGGPVDLITGNDSTFAASLGAWTASGGTLTRDTGVTLPGFTASLKHVTTGTNQYVELPIAGTFKSGQQYWAILLVQPPSNVTPTLTFGLIGTDSAARAIAIDSAEFACIGVPWTPTADRTGVKLRLLMPASGTTYYIGWAKAFLSLTTPMLNLDSYGSISRVYMPLGTNLNVSLGPHTGDNQGGLVFEYDGGTKLAAANGRAGIYNSQNWSYASLWAEHTPANLAGSGVNIEAGDDRVGIYISEKDAATIQIYDDLAGAYDIELVDQGSFGWKTVNASESTKLSLLHNIKHGTLDPSAGGGVASAIGSFYGRDNSGAGELWVKTGAGNTAWTQISGGGGSALTVDDEGTPLATDATTLDFVGAGVVASGTGATKTITISGASVADILDLPTAEMDPTLVLAPVGDGTLGFRAETGGVGRAFTFFGG